MRSKETSRSWVEMREIRSTVSSLMRRGLKGVNKDEGGRRNVGIT